MTKRIVVTGTDTDIGKTVFAAGLAASLGAQYWKPIQAGTEGGGDSASVASLGVARELILPEAYRLEMPCSPRRSAELDGIEIDLARLTLPEVGGPVVIEGAGGALVPVTRQILYADLFARWALPTVIVARTSLGTINHSLLTIEALKKRAVPILGIAFVGDANEDSEAVIAEIGEVRRLGRLPWLDPLSAESLRAAFRDGFDLDDFR